MTDVKKIAIIGGGAAGLAASIAAAREVKRLGARANVVVFERDDRVGRSILATGNGRCNFSNANPDAARYRNAAFVSAAFSALEDVEAQAAEAEARRRADGGSHAGARPGGSRADGVATGVRSGEGDAAVPVDGARLAPCENAVLRFFEGVGLLWREESEGRLYPMANKATSVLAVLRDAMRALGVREVPECHAVRIDAPERAGERYHVRFDDGRVEHADAVIVACGGALACGLLPACVPVSDAVPVLGPLATDGPVKSLDNIRVKCALELRAPDGRVKARETGELLFRKYGVSGIAAFNLSRAARPGDALLIDFAPQVPAEGCEAFLAARAGRLRETFGEGGTSMGQLLCGMLLPQVADVVLRAAKADERDLPTGERLRSLARVLKGFRLTVRGIGDARQCQVHRGGVPISAVDAASMRVRGLPGLFVAGEALDVDAPCGGFNLHWAWASGLVAGHAAARSAVGAARADARCEGAIGARHKNAWASDGGGRSC